MYKIAYIIPYFGEFNNYFELWLQSCRYNPTIDFLIFTDDKRPFDYPKNVFVRYMTFFELREKIQKLYPFKISLDRPYRLCDYRPAYGEIFSRELKGYDYWGYCDMDLIWGDIRKFMTDDILEKYDRVGFQGHSSLYKNNNRVNCSYRLPLESEIVYKEIFTEDRTHFFDEWKSLEILREHEFSVYKEIIFAHPTNLYWHFYLRYFENKYDYKNKYQAFMWINGKMYRIYLDKKDNYEMKVEEYMYMHLMSRIMKLPGNEDFKDKSILITPNQFSFCQIESPFELDERLLKKCNKGSCIKYLKWWFEKERTWRSVLKFFKNTFRQRCRIIIRNNK